ncbi:uncharacterized protein [Montipora capricornis]|uniref:uncharacterized protein n=1 Tax=Montipora capricornis TaxID=246305 RepID=UPI0035F1F707
MGKACLAPIKAVTVPRLELTAAKVSVRLGEIIKKELDDKAETIQYHTGSVPVLRYIANEKKRFHVYVANRVQLIRNLSDPNQWRYVNTKENRADDASRGLDASTLTEQQRWVKRPKFSWQSEKEWPAQPTRLGEIPKDDVKVKDQVNVWAIAIVSPTAVSTVSKLLQHFSSWYRLKKAVTVFMRVKVILKERSFRRANGKSIKLNEDPSLFTVKDLEDAELAIIRFTQFLSFESELGTLEQVRSSQLKDQPRPTNSKVAVGKNSPIYRLVPFVDNGLLRVGGRLHNANIPEESKHPIVLPRKSHVTT